MRNIMRTMTRIVPSDMDVLLCQYRRNINCYGRADIRQHDGSRPAQGGIRNATLLLFDRNAAFADIDFDAGGLLPRLIELIAEDCHRNREHADNEIEGV